MEADDVVMRKGGNEDNRWESICKRFVRSHNHGRHVPLTSSRLTGTPIEIR
jgi:hypothetical protein